jgi:hypothetical protein
MLKVRLVMVERSFIGQCYGLAYQRRLRRALLSCQTMLVSNAVSKRTRMNNLHGFPFRWLLIVNEDLGLWHEGNEARLDPELRRDLPRVLVATRTPAVQRLTLTVEIANSLNGLDDRHDLSPVGSD